MKWFHSSFRALPASCAEQSENSECAREGFGPRAPLSVLVAMHLWDVDSSKRNSDWSKKERCFNWVSRPSNVFHLLVSTVPHEATKLWFFARSSSGPRQTCKATKRRFCECAACRVEKPRLAIGMMQKVMIENQNGKHLWYVDSSKRNSDWSKKERCFNRVSRPKIVFHLLVSTLPHEATKLRFFARSWVCASYP